MSFDYNPYEHIEVIKRTEDTVAINCSSCGGERPKHFMPGLPMDTPIAELFAIMAEHIATSHKRSREDFASWSKY